MKLLINRPGGRRVNLCVCLALDCKALWKFDGFENVYMLSSILWTQPLAALFGLWPESSCVFGKGVAPSELQSSLKRSEIIQGIRNPCPTRLPRYTKTYCSYAKPAHALNIAVPPTLQNQSWVTYRPQGRLIGSLIYRGDSVGRFGSPWVPFGCLWELLGVTSGPLGTLLGGCRGHFGSPWGAFGTSWAALGCVWELLRVSGVSLGRLGGVMLLKHHACRQKKASRELARLATWSTHLS